MSGNETALDNIKEIYKIRGYGLKSPIRRMLCHNAKGVRPMGIPTGTATTRRGA
jgi:hypothetical protein